LSAIAQPVFANVVSVTRAPRSAARYRLMNPAGESPIHAKTKDIARALAERLGVPVRVAMRYGQPSIRSVLDACRFAKCDQALVLPLYPQPCSATSVSTEHEFHNHAGAIKMYFAHGFSSHPAYIQALVQQIDKALAHVPPNPHLLFCAHNIPGALQRAGDPYVPAIEQTVRDVWHALSPRFSAHSLAWQSRSGPVKWLSPSPHDELTRLHREGVRSVVTAPISFVCDNIENLVEIDIELRKTALEMGFEHFAMMPSLNDHPLLIDALVAAVETIAR
jgi:ferrochelatase